METKIAASRDLTQGPIWKKLILFFLPIAASTWFQQLYNAVDAIIVGRFVGTEALAAVGGSAATLTNLVIGFFTALTGGASVVIAQLYGGKKEEQLRRATGTAVLLCFLIGLVLTGICLIFVPTFLVWLKTPADTLADATDYLWIYFSCSSVVLVLNIESGILRAVGDSRRPFLFMFAACILNIVLDYVFVVYLHWNVKGVAYATVLSQVLNFLLLTASLLRTREAYGLRWKELRLDGGLIRRMMRIGVPASLEASMYNVSNMVLQVAVNSLSTVVVASWSLSTKIDGFYWATSNAAGMAVINFVGQNFGAGKMDRVHRCAKVGFRIFLPITIVLSTIILLVAPYVLPTFSKDPAVVETTYKLLLYFVPFYFLWTAVEIFSGTLKGCGVVKPPVLITGLGICAFRVIWKYTAFAMHPTLLVLSICYAISWAITSAAMFLYYKKGNWQKQALEGASL